ncbi:MAG: hypothetical protein ACRCYU_02550 [Nocardioides sp.]
MRASVWDLVWVAGVLDHCPQVPALSVAVRTGGLIRNDGRSVEVVELDVHARSLAAGRQLAHFLGLVEDETAYRVTECRDGVSLAWRTWTGWVPDASRDVPVRVEVVASDAIDDQAVA